MKKKTKLFGKVVEVDVAINAAKEIIQEKIKFCDKSSEIVDNLRSKLNVGEPTALDNLFERKMNELIKFYDKAINAETKALQNGGKSLEQVLKNAVSYDSFEEFENSLEQMLKDTKNLSDYSANVSYSSIESIVEKAAGYLHEENKFCDDYLNENHEESDL